MFLGRVAMHGWIALVSSQLPNLTAPGVSPVNSSFRSDEYNNIWKPLGFRDLELQHGETLDPHLRRSSECG